MCACKSKNFQLSIEYCIVGSEISHSESESEQHREASTYWKQVEAASGDNEPVCDVAEDKINEIMCCRIFSFKFYMCLLKFYRKLSGE